MLNEPDARFPYVYLQKTSNIIEILLDGEMHIKKDPRPADYLPNVYDKVFFNFGRVGRNHARVSSGSFGTCVGLALYDTKNKFGCILHFPGGSTPAIVENALKEMFARIKVHYSKHGLILALASTKRTLSPEWKATIMGGISLNENPQKRTKEIMDEINRFISKEMTNTLRVDVKKAGSKDMVLDLNTGNVTVSGGNKAVY